MVSPNWVPQTFRKSLVLVALEAAFALPLALAWHVHAAVPVPETTAWTSGKTIRKLLKKALKFGYGSIPINTIFSGMNIHLPAILMWTTGVQGFDTLPFHFGAIILRHWNVMNWKDCAIQPIKSVAHCGNKFRAETSEAISGIQGGGGWWEQLEQHSSLFP